MPNMKLRNAAYIKGIEAAKSAAQRRVYLPPICPYGLYNRVLMDEWASGVEDYQDDPVAALKWLSAG